MMPVLVKTSLVLYKIAVAALSSQHGALAPSWEFTQSQFHLTIGLNQQIKSRENLTKEQRKRTLTDPCCTPKGMFVRKSSFPHTVMLL